MTHRIYEAAVDQSGQVRLLETMVCARPTRALVIVLEGEQPSSELTCEPTVSNDNPSDTVAAISNKHPSWLSRYRPIRELGQGGIGQVLLAERLSDGASVCVKVFRGGVNRAVLQQECRALLRLKHPSIVSLLDFSTEETPQWLVMEYATGSPLRACLNERGSFLPGTAVEILKQALEGLAYAHSQQVIHRDLKPENIMVADQPSGLAVRIVDFGLAIVDLFDLHGHYTATNSPLAGTLLYMSPEQLNSERLGPACDIYAVGLIAYEMLTGRLPFHVKDLCAVLLEKLRAPTGWRLAELPVAAPVPLANLIEACTQPNPNSRPTASDALTILKGLSL